VNIIYTKSAIVGFKIAKLIKKNNFNHMNKNEVIFDLSPLITDKVINLSNDGEISFTESFCKKHYRKLRNFGFSHYQILALYKSDFTAIYFMNELLTIFTNNSKYHFKWVSYRGYVISSDESNDRIYIKNLCLAHDLKSGNPVVSIFLYELLEQDVDFQNFVERYEIVPSHNMQIMKQNITNLIYGERYKYEEIDIYNLLLTGIDIVNRITKDIFGDTMFTRSYEISELEHFHPIFVPSKINYYLFVLELYKILYQNLNKELVKKIYDSKSVLGSKKKPKLSDMLRNIIEDSVLATTFEDFAIEISDLRNVPAHRIYNNEFNRDYWKKQDELLVFSYQFINAFIIGFNDNQLPDKYKNFSTIYGKKGSISTGNGFNQSPYKYFDGQVRLVCEKFQERDAEFLIAFKNKENQIQDLSSLIIAKRPDLTPEVVSFLVDKLVLNSSVSATPELLKSFFKGYNMTKHFVYNPEVNITFANNLYCSFINRYSLDNIILFADSTDPNFSEIVECLDDNELFGRGYFTELIRDFKNNNEYDIVITNPEEDTEIQILNNIWD